MNLSKLGLVAAAAGLLFTSSLRPSAVPRHLALWLPAGDVDVRTVTAGSGAETVVLLHGYAESLMAFRSVFDRLSLNHRVMALDLPGFGASDKPEGTYDLESYVSRLSDLLDHQTEGPLVLVGHSMGGEVAAALALARPQRVASLVLIAAAGYGLSPAFEALADDGGDGLGWVNSLVGLLLPLHDPIWLEEPGEVADYDPVLDPRYRRSLTRVLEDFDFAALRGRLDRVKQPVLLIWGRRDPTIPYELGLAMAEDLPCATMVTVERTLHRPHQTEPGLVAAAIEDFLRQPECAAAREIEQ